MVYISETTSNTQTHHKQPYTKMPDMATMTVGPRVPREFRSVTHTAQLIHQTRSKLRSTRSSSPLRALQLSNLLTDLQTHLRYSASAAPPPSYEEALRERRRERYDLPEHYLRQDFDESDYALEEDEDDEGEYEEDEEEEDVQPWDRDAVEEWQEHQGASCVGGPHMTAVDHECSGLLEDEDDDDMPSLTRVWSRTNDFPVEALESDDEDMPALTRQSSRCDTTADTPSDEDFESHDDAEDDEEDVEHHDSEGEGDLLHCKTAILDYLRSTKVAGLTPKRAEQVSPMSLKFQSRVAIQPIVCAAG